MRGRSLVLVLVTLFIFIVLLQTSIIPNAQSLEKPITRKPLPGYPLIAKPGSSYIVELKQGIAREINSVYLARVSLGKDTKLVRQEHVLQYEILSDAVLRIFIPEHVEKGLYDLILTINGVNHTVPNAVWILDSLPQSLIILHQSDDHATGGRDLRASAGLLAQLLGVDIILDTGDVTDKASTIEAKDYLDTIISYYGYIPLFVAPGNHDTGSRAFEEYIAPRVWFKLVDWLFLATLDTGEKGYPSMEQLALLKQALEENNNASAKIVMFHHPLFWYWGRLETSSQDKNLIEYVSNYWKPAIDVAREFLELVENYNVTMVLAGHIHRDMLTQYYSTRSGTTTLFLTTTTLSGSRPYCNGFHIIILDRKGNYSLPFISEEDKCYSISVDRNLARYFYVRPVTSGSAIGLIIHNKLNLELNGTAILRIPWTDGGAELAIFNVTTLYGLPSATLLDYMLYKDRMIIALNLSLPSPSGLKIVLAAEPDRASPVIRLTRIFPSKPLYGSPLTIYLEIKDEGWGIENVDISVESISGKPVEYSTKSIGSNLVIVIPSVTESFKIRVQATDLAGNTRSSTFSINVTKTTQTTTGETTTISETETTTTLQPTKTNYTRYTLVAVIAAVAALLIIILRKK